MVVSGSVVGFSAHCGLDTSAELRHDRAVQRMLKHFPWLAHRRWTVGDTTVHVWGHGMVEQATAAPRSGGLIVVAGSPAGALSPGEILSAWECASSPECFRIPWDGRVTVFHVRPDGREWMAWTDWVGSIPVFCASLGKGRIAGSLEPAVVAAAGYGPGDISLHGLVSLLVNGHYLGCYTLYQGMTTLPPDSFCHWSRDRRMDQPLRTVAATTERWDRPTDDLVEEMHELLDAATREALRGSAAWILPLSGGLDSRLLAAMCHRGGVAVRTYTYPIWSPIEAYAAKRVAQVLRLPWRLVPVPADFLAENLQGWADSFGTALHFHGMYHVPFLRALRSDGPAPAILGYLGDVLSGSGLRNLSCSFERPYPGLPIFGADTRWTVEELRFLVRYPLTHVVDELVEDIKSQINKIEGSLFQKLTLYDLTNRQRLFIYYHPMIYDYWLRAATPYHNRAYANFCLSLPLMALERRYLLCELYRRFYPKLASIVTAYGSKPIAITTRYLMKRKLVSLVPTLRFLPYFREFCIYDIVLESESTKTGDRAAFWPIFEVWDELEEWLNMDVVKSVIEAAQRGDLWAHKKHLPIQTLAFALLRDKL